MSGTRKKLNAIFFTFVMVTSVFAGTAAFTGVAIANAPGPVGNQDAGDFEGDQSPSVSTLPGDEVLVAELNFSDNPGEINRTDITANESNSSNLDAGDIDSYRVVAINGSEVLAENSTDAIGSNSANSATIGFANTDANNSSANGAVDRVRVFATVASATQVDGDETIDAGVEIFDSDGTTFSGTSPYDTQGTQNVSTQAGFITGEVKNGDGDPIDNRTDIVEVRNADSDVLVDTIDTDAEGDFDPDRLRVAPGNNYTVEVDIPGFTTFVETQNVGSGQTIDFPATVEFNLQADNLRVERFDGETVTGQTDSTLLADGRSDNTAQYAVIVENTAVVENPNIGINESNFDVSVDLSFNGAPVVGDFIDNDANNTTATVSTTQRGDVDDDGFVESFQTFEVTADNANESSLNSSIVTNDIDANANALGLRNNSSSVQYVLEGDDVITGEVTTPSGGLPNATVWAAFSSQSNQSLAFTQETFVNNGDVFLADTSIEDGDYTIDGLALPEDPTDIKLYVVTEDDIFNRLNRTNEPVGRFVAAEFTLNSSTDFSSAGDNQQADQRIAVFEDQVDFEFRLNVTVDDADGNPVKSADIAQDDTRDVTVTVEQRPFDRGDEFTSADAGQNVTVSLTDSTQGTLADTSLTTDADGEATTSFTAASAASGTTNVTASTENDRGGINESTGSEQAEINVFGAAAITGDVVNEDSQNLPNATVRLFDGANTNLNDSNALTTVTTGDLGSYTISEVDGERLQSGDGPSGNGFIVEAEFDNETETRTFENLTPGTNEGDIAIIGVTPAAAEFQVSDLSPTNVTVTQGDDITVNATITNVGDQSGEQTVEFRANGSVLDQESVSLTGDDSTPVTFNNVTVDLDPGSFTHGVFTQDNNQTATLTVEQREQQQEPSVSVNFTDQTVPNGTEEVTVDNANFTRADGSAGDYVVVVHTIDEFGAPVGNVSAPIGASGDLTGAEENITVDLTTADGPINSTTENVTLRAMLHTTANDSAFGNRLGNEIDGIERGDETDDANITVEEAVEDAPANFEVSDLEPQDATVNVSEAFDVSVTVENTGDLQSEQEIELRLEPDGDAVRNQTVSLDAGENDTVTFDNVTVDTAGEFNHTVASANDSVSGNLTVEQQEQVNRSVEVGRQFAGEDDVIGSLDLLDAVEAFRNDEIDTFTVLELIEFFRNETDLSQV